jgi:putative membrane protein insertion efficiency factor
MISKLEIFAITAYQKVSHPVYSLLNKAHINVFGCKYTPSCSVYAKEAITKYGTIKGTSLAIKRIIRCNPSSRGGYDPVV